MMAAGIYLENGFRLEALRILATRQLDHQSTAQYTKSISIDTTVSISQRQTSPGHHVYASTP